MFAPVGLSLHSIACSGNWLAAVVSQYCLFSELVCYCLGDQFPARARVGTSMITFICLLIGSARLRVWPDWLVPFHCPLLFRVWLTWFRPGPGGCSGGRSSMPVRLARLICLLSSPFSPLAFFHVVCRRLSPLSVVFPIE